MAESDLTLEQRAERLLRVWGEALLGLQVRGPNAGLHGAMKCPACARVHGRCVDAVQPFMHLARSTGEARWVRAAEDVFGWAEANVSMKDGSWINDLDSGWRGITVFGAIALGEALRLHADLLSAATAAAWRKRLAAAAGFIDRTFTLTTGNINYPASAPAALALAAQLCERPKWLKRARQFATEVLSRYVSPQGFLWGEGRKDGASPRGVFAVDLGYNVAESLPNLALYAELTGDAGVLAAVVAGYRAHLPFLLPDGGWDCGWATRQFKWTWWGSRTTDGCMHGLAAVAGQSAECAGALATVLSGLEKATHGGLLHPGLHHARRGMPACVHHTFCHAKGLAALLDRPARLPRTVAVTREGDGLSCYRDLGVTVVRHGPWRASFSVADIGYNENPAYARTIYPPCGGSCTLLWHDAVGPVLAASMIDYQCREPNNMEAVHRPDEAYPLTPEVVLNHGASSWRSVRDTQATLTVDADGAGVLTRARLVDAALADPPEGPVVAIMHWRFTRAAVTLEVELRGPADMRAVVSVPVIAAGDAPVTAMPGGARVAVGGQSLELTADSAEGAEMPLDERVFNHVPGMEAIPWRCAVRPGRGVRLTLAVS